jgi:hypothetical protein
MPPNPDLVKDSKLETTFDHEYTRHVYYISGATPHERKLRKEERWKRDKYLGSGAFAAVWLEKFVTDTGEVQHRAVKEIKKRAKTPKAIDYSRELEAIAKFSHPKVCEPPRLDSCIPFGTITFLPSKQLKAYQKSSMNDAS